MPVSPIKVKFKPRFIDGFNEGGASTPFSFVSKRKECFYSYNSPYYCRELFQRNFKVDNKRNYHIVINQYNSIHNVARFFDVIERKLKIEEKSIFHETNYVFCVLIKPSSFWTSSRMRFSLFTLLIRAAGTYKNRNNSIKEALNENRFTRNTINAINRFLSGHTENEKYKGGWVNYYTSHDYNYRNIIERPERVEELMKPSL